jgi:uncharacterized membrane protein
MNTDLASKDDLSPRAAVAIALAILAFTSTFFIRIPIPVTQGYFNLGDIFVILAGLWLGPWAGFLVGLTGPAAADAIGYPQFILATAVTKSAEGLLAGLISGGNSSPSMTRHALGAAIGGLVMVLGYFVFEAYIYPALSSRVPLFAGTDIAAAIGEVGPNFVQAAVGALVGFLLWRTVSGTQKDTESD